MFDLSLSDWGAVAGILTLLLTIGLVIEKYVSYRRDRTPILQLVESFKRDNYTVFRLTVIPPKEYVEIDDISVSGHLIGEMQDAHADHPLRNIARFGEWRESLPFVVQLDPREANCSRILFCVQNSSDEMLCVNIKINAMRFPIKWRISAMIPNITAPTPKSTHR